MKKQRINYKDCHKTIDGVEYKMCKKCMNWFIMNEENFKVQPSQKDGFSHKCRTCQEEYNHQIYMNNREKYIEDVRQRRKKDPSLNRKNVEQCKRKYHEDPRRREMIRNTSRKSRENGTYQKWLDRNPDKQTEYRIKRNHKNHKITQEEWLSCKEYFNNSCAYCGLPADEHFVKRKGQLVKYDLHKEHVDHEGSVYLDNCVPSCGLCNSFKHKFTLAEWYNSNNPNFTQERYNKIIKWITEDCKKYIVTK